MISFKLTDEQEVVRETLHGFAEADMRKVARESDEASEIPQDFLAKGWELGLVSTQLPAEFGGGGEEGWNGDCIFPGSGLKTRSGHRRSICHLRFRTNRNPSLPWS